MSDPIAAKLDRRLERQDATAAGMAALADVTEAVRDKVDGHCRLDRLWAVRFTEQGAEDRHGGVGGGPA